MTDMPRPRPPHLQIEKTRHSRTVWYVRVGKGPRIRLKSAYGTDAFAAEYAAAIAGRPIAAPDKATAGSLKWLCERYRDSGAWMTLARTTRQQREAIFAGVIQTAGATPIRSINRVSIIASRDRRAATPGQARNFLDAMRGLFRWALEAGHVAVDPTFGVKNLKRAKTGGFKVWTEEDVAAYEARWPRGTRQRVWLDVLLYTGLRRSDAVRIGRQHVRDGIATIRTEKSQGAMIVTIPILPALAATLEAGPCGDLAFICGTTGAPLTKNSFGNALKAACVAAGIDEPKKVAHGLRKIGATRAAENGATVAELEAIFGWSGGGMASLYTRAADRSRLSKGAITKLERTSAEHPIPAPDQKVRAAKPKRK